MHFTRFRTLIWPILLRGLTMLPAIGDRTEALLRDLLPRFSPIIRGTELHFNAEQNTSSIELPAAQGAEYCFILWFTDNGEREISAKLMPRGNEHQYFWYRPFELAEFRGNLETLEAKFCEELRILLTHETRIVQEKGWIFWSFRCDYRLQETWKRLYSHLALRWFNPPSIAARSRVYCSAPVASSMSVS